MIGWGQVLRRLSTDEPLTEQGDAALLRLFLLQRSAEAFACLVRRHGPLVLRLCQRELLEAGDAEDAFQATFLLLAQKARSIRMTENLAPWLAGVARRLARRLARQLRRRRERLMELAASRQLPKPPPTNLSETAPSWWEEERRHLPQEYQNVIDLCLIQGHSREEAARLLHLSPSAVHGLLYRARLKLKKQLMKRGTVVATGFAATQASAATIDRLTPHIASTAVQMMDRGLAAIASPTVALLVTQRSAWLWLAPGLVLLGTIAGGVAWWNRPSPFPSPTGLALSIVPSVPLPETPQQPPSQVPPPQQLSPPQQLPPQSEQVRQTGNQQLAPQPQQFVPQPQQGKGIQQLEQQQQGSFAQSQAQPPTFPVPPADRVPTDAERSMLARTLETTPGLMPHTMLARLPHASRQPWHGKTLHLGMITSDAEYQTFTTTPPVRTSPKQKPLAEKPPWIDEKPKVDWATELLVIVVLEENAQSATLRSLEENWIAPDDQGVAHLMLRYAAPEPRAALLQQPDYAYVLAKVSREKLKRVAVTIWRPAPQPDGVTEVPAKGKG
jgi:RNA polymerase sigma factor (sigma-70 family)